MSKGMKLRFLVMLDLWEGLAMRWWLAPLCCSIWMIRIRALSLPNPLSCPVPLWPEEESRLPAGSWRRRFCSDRRTFTDRQWNCINANSSFSFKSSENKWNFLGFSCYPNFTCEQNKARNSQVPKKNINTFYWSIFPIIMLMQSMNSFIRDFAVRLPTQQPLN